MNALMSIWQKLFNSKHEQNSQKNNMACIENDCSCKSNEQLIQALKAAHDEYVVKGIKRVLMSRGFSRKELDQFKQHTIH